MTGKESIIGVKELPKSENIQENASTMDNRIKNSYGYLSDGSKMEKWGSNIQKDNDYDFISN